MKQPTKNDVTAMEIGVGTGQNVVSEKFKYVSLYGIIEKLQLVVAVH